MLHVVIAAIDPMEEKTNEFLRTVKDRRQFIALQMNSHLHDTLCGGERYPGIFAKPGFCRTLPRP